MPLPRFLVITYYEIHPAQHGRVNPTMTSLGVALQQWATKKPQLFMGKGSYLEHTSSTRLSSESEENQETG